MTFDRSQRLSILRENAPAYVDMALVNIVREYPHMPWFVASGPESYRTHKAFHPAFYGCLDWHSCVELHWVSVRLLRLCPDRVNGAAARDELNALLTTENL